MTGPRTASATRAASATNPAAAGSTALDRRDRRRRATEDEIRSAAIELVALHGVDKVSIDMIAERADIGYRTFFNYFTCKEAALVEPGHPKGQRIAVSLLARPDDESPLEALRAALLTEFADFDAHRDDFCLRMSVIEANPTVRPWFAAQMVATERAIAEAIAVRTRLDPETALYPHLLAAVAGTALRTCMVRWRAQGSTGSPRPLIREAFDALAAGLTSP